MKKYIGKALLCLLAVALLLPLGAGAVTTTVWDRAQLLSPTDEAKISSELGDFYQEYNCYLMVLTDTVRYDDANLPDIAEDEGYYDLILLTISQVGSEYYYYLYTYGSGYYALDDDSVNDILDAPEVYDNLKSGRIAEGIYGFLDATRREVDFDRAPTGEWDLDHAGTGEWESESVFANIFVCLTCGVLVAVICCIVVIVRYKGSKKHTIYPLDKFAKLTLHDRRDIFLGTVVTKHKVSSSSSGGSRSGGSRSGGGRSGGGRGGR